MSFCLAKRTDNRVARVSVMAVRVTRVDRMVQMPIYNQCTTMHTDTASPHQSQPPSPAHGTCLLKVSANREFPTRGDLVAHVRVARGQVRMQHRGEIAFRNDTSRAYALVVPHKHTSTEHQSPLTTPAISTDPKLTIVTFARALSAKGARPSTPGV